MKQTSLTTFLVKRQRPVDDPNSAVEEPPKKISPQATTIMPVQLLPENSAVNDPGASIISTQHTSLTFPFDIGDASLDPNSFNDSEKLKFLKDVWMPTVDFCFPPVEEGGKKRTFQMSWLHRFPWLAYSRKMNGGFCKFCIFFVLADVSNSSSVSPGVLVKHPLGKFKNALETCESHQNTNYHKTAMEFGENFCKVISHSSESVVALIDKGRQAGILENRSRLIPSIEAVLFSGLAELPLRGHRDYGELQLSEPVEKDGIFRALLRYKVRSGDKALESHILSASKNATYISWNIQNQIIAAIESILRERICDEVKRSRFFTVIADETTDCATQSQFSICLRYVNIEEQQIKERFLGFYELSSNTAESFSNTLLNVMSENHLDMTLLRGQSYDGCATMSGEFNGVQARVKQINPKAVYVHCFSHQLNLCLTHSSTVHYIRNAIGVIMEASNFFSKSPLRCNQLLLSIDESAKNNVVLARKLKAFCATRWVESHAAVLRFIDLFPALLHAMRHFSLHSDSKTSSKAMTLLSAMTASDFLVSAAVLSKTSALILPLSEALQSVDLDLNGAVENIEEVKEQLVAIRADESFCIIFDNACSMATLAESEITMPRILQRQKQRGNIPAQSTLEYYKRNAFLPYIDYLIVQIQSRFTDGRNTALKLQFLLPKYSTLAAFDDITEAAEFYRDDLPEQSNDALEAEFKRWTCKWMKVPLADRPSTVIEALQNCNRIFFPNIFTLLHIFATLPVTSASAERSFSTHRRLKTYLRSTMKTSRLSGLAHMSINRDLAIQLQGQSDVIIDELAKVPRRLDFLLR